MSVRQGECEPDSDGDGASDNQVVQVVPQSPTSLLPVSRRNEEYYQSRGTLKLPTIDPYNCSIPV